MRTTARADESDGEAEAVLSTYESDGEADATADDGKRPTRAAYESDGEADATVDDGTADESGI